MSTEYEIHWAPKDKVYVHKDKNLKLYGEMVVILPDDDYTLQDFELIKEKELLNYFKEIEGE